MIPIIDCEGKVSNKSNEIFEAMTTVGGAQLKNFGISVEEISNMFETANQFFALPLEIKKKFTRPMGDEHFRNAGYLPVKAEQLNENTHEMRETFDFRQKYMTGKIQEEMPEFFNKVTQFYEQCGNVSLQIMKLFAQRLIPEDEEFFTKRHSFNDSVTTLGLFLYHAIENEADMSNENVVRLEEHSDYGTITLIFQNNQGWLERRDENDQFVPIVNDPEAVLLLAGDLLHFWSGGKIKALRHRVTFPKSYEARKISRGSMVFFGHPDDDCEVKPLDGSNRFPTVLAGDYAWGVYSTVYK